MKKKAKIVSYEYGAMSSRYRVRARNKLTAYATMCYHYNRSAHMVAIYQPESSNEDMWLSLDGKISARLDEIFGGDGSFDKYCLENMEEIADCYKTIKKLS